MKGAVLVLGLLTLVVSARTKLTATLHGQSVSIPVLWLVAAAVVLALAAVVGTVAWLVYRARSRPMRSDGPGRPIEASVVSPIPPQRALSCRNPTNRRPSRDRGTSSTPISTT